MLRPSAIRAGVGAVLAAAGLLANAAPSAARINVDPAASQAAEDAVAACLAQIKTVPRGA
jgi:hypothetical protein